MPADNVTPVTNPETGEVSDRLVPQDGAYAVYAEHIRALNNSDWLGLMAQYPEDAEIHMPNGVIARGREAIGEMFAGAVLAHDRGGIAGLVFTGVSELRVGGTLTVNWEADADWLDEPYRGSDAYVSDGRFMVAMVSTFNADDLAIKQ